MARCAALSIRRLYHDRAVDQEIDPDGLNPGVALTIHTHGDFSNWQPHIHCLVTAGVADQQGELTPLDLPWPPTAEADFQARILRLMKRRERLTPEQVGEMLAWAHSGFSVHNAVCADPSSPDEMMRLAPYLLHPPIALERLRYHGKSRPLVYSGRRPDHRTGARSRAFDPFEFLAEFCLHIPPPRLHLTRL
ncbi:MAG: transposase [Acidobacteriota bacterium]|nr:transposase [Acidobacteriota bacterium]